MNRGINGYSIGPAKKDVEEKISKIEINYNASFEDLYEELSKTTNEKRRREIQQEILEYINSIEQE